MALRLPQSFVLLKDAPDFNRDCLVVRPGRRCKMGEKMKNAICVEASSVADRVAMVQLSHALSVLDGSSALPS